MPAAVRRTGTWFWFDVARVAAKRSEAGGQRSEVDLGLLVLARRHPFVL